MRNNAKTNERREFLRRALFGAAVVCASGTLNAVWANDELPALPEGVSVTFEKIENQPSVAIVKIDGAETRVEAFEPLEKVPEAARDYVRAHWETTGEFPKKRINVTVNVSEAPDVADWAESAKNRLVYWYPKIVEALEGAESVEQIPDDFKIDLIFKPMDGVAYCAGRTIVVSSRWVKQRPDDFGLIVHEATHVAQAYGRVETWAMEGIADYVRYYISEPSSKNHWRVDPERSKYTDSYGVTASFYDWIIREKDPKFMQKLHRAFRSRTRVDKFWADEYRSTPAAYWDEFVKTLK